MNYADVPNETKPQVNGFEYLLDYKTKPFAFMLPSFLENRKLFILFQCP